MREWLTVIIALLIIAVVLDGVRRMRQARRSGLRMSSRMPRDTSPRDPNTYGSELPNGGARVVNVRKPDDAEQRYREIRQSREANKRRLGRPNRIPEQVALNLDEHVPLLMEVEQERSVVTSASPERSEPRRQQEKQQEPRSYPKDPLEDYADDGRIEPQLSQTRGDLYDSEREDGNSWQQSADAEAEEAPLASPKDDQAPVRGDANYPREQLEEEIEYREPEDVLVINVMAPKGEHFRGDALLDTVLDCGMRFGSMNIFHHHEHLNGEGGVLYSMANIVVPGTFDLDTMQNFSTPGVSLFLALPVDGDSSVAFDKMLNTAKALARNLGGEMKDERRSVMTTQTVEHYRSRIKEFERKQLSRAPL
ncbi:MAG: cell division protein ZipA [Cellvibrionaceae bacterium]